MTQRMFQRSELSAGACPNWQWEEHLNDNARLPAYEPCVDHFHGSHRLVEQVRALVDTFDSIGLLYPRGNEVLISNLMVLSDLANAAALHMRAVVDDNPAEQESLPMERKVA